MSLSKSVDCVNKFLDNLIKFLSLTSGKDKLAKILQYGAKLLGYMALRRSPKSDWIKVWKQLETTSGSARKVWRLGNTFAEQKKIIDLFKVARPFAPLNILAMIRQFGMYFYWVFDHLILLTNIGLHKFDTVKLGWYSSVSWFAGLLCSIIIDLNTLKQTLSQENSLKLQTKSLDDQEYKDKLKATLKKKNELYLNFIKNVADLLIAATLLKFYQFSQGTVGVAGMTSAVIGGYQMWPK
ncbi:transmembrane protein [Tieghemostelium lacteum]|uniref:Transmembrane protein n=1 Tax=Tieghemostelium lacteum TaxID=361077 RepID=A0A151ZCA2_TIELA|nr:transmembrane protein [Tieghemostelium lacteum]|eukprot:KYQ91576.1 transmembrane protein [Tieghemostelium lacteum]